MSWAVLFVHHWQIIPFPFWSPRDICHFSILGKQSSLIYILFSSTSFIFCRKPLHLLSSERHSFKQSYHCTLAKRQEFKEFNFYNRLASILCSTVFSNYQVYLSFDSFFLSCIWLLCDITMLYQAWKVEPVQLHLHKVVLKLDKIGSITNI